ncbi:hypothetical protein RHBI111906_02600 [Rhodothermus bifroesti]
MWALWGCLGLWPWGTFAQEGGNAIAVQGMVTLTNKGVSFIPAFTLGKPAVVFDGSLGRRLRFEPQLRFALEGRPWSFLFWWRYPLWETQRFRLRLGGHPALAFRTRSVLTDAGREEVTVVWRFLAGELGARYTVAHGVDLGLQYLYSRGVEKTIPQPKNTHYLALQPEFSARFFSQKLTVTLRPQVYYLRVDDQQGYYLATSLTLRKQRFPLMLSGLLNRSLQTNLPGRNLVWNVSLGYVWDI